MSGKIAVKKPGSSNVAEHRNACSSPHALYFSERYKSAMQWLESSGVLCPDGGVIAWLAPENPTQQFVSAEIAGYAVSFFCWCGQSERALHIARWLVSVAQDSFGAFRCRWLHPDVSSPAFRHDGPVRWIFDTGIALKGLVDVYQMTALSEFEAPIEAATTWLLSIRQEDGLFPGRWDASSGSPFDDVTRWSSQPGSYHAKVDRSIAAAAFALGRSEWLEGVEQRVNLYISRYQKADGAFISYPHTEGIHAHPHLYTCESLWALGALLNNPAWTQAARCGVEWIATASDSSGRFPRTVFGSGSHFMGRGDAAAQYLRALLLFEQPESRRSAAAARLEEFFDANGACVFGWNSNGSRNEHPDTWGTMAAIQALSWYTGSYEPNPLALL